jgi:hypothetical protein
MRVSKFIQKLVGATDEKAFNTAIADAQRQHGGAIRRAAEARAELDAAVALRDASETLQSELLAEGGDYDAAGSARAQDAIRAAETKLRVCEGAVVTTARNIEQAEAARHDFRIDTAKQGASKAQRAIVAAAQEFGRLVDANRAAIEQARSLGIATIMLDGPAVIAAWANAAERDLAPRVEPLVDARRVIKFLKSADVARENGYGSVLHVAGDVAGFTPAVAAKLVSRGLAAFYVENEGHAAAIAEAGRALESEAAARSPRPNMDRLYVRDARSEYIE